MPIKPRLTKPGAERRAFTPTIYSHSPSRKHKPPGSDSDGRRQQRQRQQRNPARLPPRLIPRSKARYGERLSQTPSSHGRRADNDAIRHPRLPRRRGARQHLARVSGVFQPASENSLRRRPYNSGKQGLRAAIRGIRRQKRRHGLLAAARLRETRRPAQQSIYRAPSRPADLRPHDVCQDRASQDRHAV